MISGSKSKTVFLDLNLLDDLAFENFVAGFHVREIEISGDVAKQRQNPVSDRAPEIEDPMHFGTDKTRSINNIGAPFLNRTKQPRILRSIIFQVEILDAYNVPCNIAKSRSRCGSFALINSMPENPDPGIAIANLLQSFPRTILRAIVNHNQFMHFWLSHHDAYNF